MIIVYVAVPGRADLVQVARAPAAIVVGGVLQAVVLVVRHVRSFHRLTMTGLLLAVAEKPEVRMIASTFIAVACQSCVMMFQPLSKTRTTRFCPPAKWWSVRRSSPGLS